MLSHWINHCYLCNELLYTYQRKKWQLFDKREVFVCTGCYDIYSNFTKHRNLRSEASFFPSTKFGKKLVSVANGICEASKAFPSLV